MATRWFIARQIGQHRSGHRMVASRATTRLTERRRWAVNARVAPVWHGRRELQAPVVRGGERLRQPTEQPREHADGGGRAGHDPALSSSEMQPLDIDALCG